MIPNQIEITSDTQTMRDLLKEGIDFYHLTPAEHKEFFLVDTRLKKLLNPDILVKDHFPFRKGTTPQVWALRTDMSSFLARSTLKNPKTPLLNSNSSEKVTIVEIDPDIAHAQIIEMNILQLCGDIARVSLMLSLLKQAKDPEAEGYFTKTELLSRVSDSNYL